MQLGEPVEVPGGEADVVDVPVGVEVAEAGADVEPERVGLPRPDRVALRRRSLGRGDAVAAQLLAQLVGQRRGGAVVAHVHARRLAGGHALVAGEHAVAVAHRRAADPAHPDADAVVPGDPQRSEDVDAHRDEPQAHQAVRPVLEVRVERLAAQLHAGVLEPAHERVAADAAARVEVAVLRGVLEEHGEQRRLTAGGVGGGHAMMMASRAAWRRTRPLPLHPTTAVSRAGPPGGSRRGGARAATRRRRGAGCA